MALPFSVTVRSRAFFWRLSLTKALAYTPLQATGQQWFTLAFITADQERKVPAWAGTIGLEKQFLMDQVNETTPIELLKMHGFWSLYDRAGEAVSDGSGKFTAQPGFISGLSPGWHARLGMGRQSATYQAKPCLRPGSA